MMGGQAGGVGLGWIWPVILLVGVVVLLWGLLQARSASSRGTGSRDRTGTGSWTGAPGSGGREGGPGAGGAREILRERYARGEISEDELRMRMRALDER